jgi:hypothetical protein
VSVKKELKFGDTETERYWEQRKKDFIAERKKRYRGKNYSSATQKTLYDGATKGRSAIVRPNKTTPWWFCVSGYALSVVLGLVYVYRMMVERHVYDRAVWVCEKVVIVGNEAAPKGVPIAFY